MRQPISWDETRGETVFNGLERAGMIGPGPVFRGTEQVAGRPRLTQEPNWIDRAGGVVSNTFDRLRAMGAGMAGRGSPMRQQPPSQAAPRILDVLRGFPGALRRDINTLRQSGLTGPLPPEAMQAARTFQDRITQNPMMIMGMHGGVANSIPLPSSQVASEVARYGADSARAIAPKLTPTVIDRLSQTPQLRQVFEEIVKQGMR